jgi:hypothetical protein
MSELSVRLQKWLEHVRCASEAGVSLRAYAMEHGLSPSVLYQAKSDLMKLGAWPRSVVRKVRTKSVPGFVQVKVASASCRLSHVSGWSIDCNELPSAQWLNVLVRGVAHAT